MTTKLTFKKATRDAVKLKIGLEGPAGAGKTEGMLSLLTGVAEGGKIAVADSENESASYYADRYDFDTIGIDSTTTHKTIMEIVNVAAKEGYAALGIDSLSRVWQNTLDAKEEYERANPSANRFTMWGMDRFGGGWNKMMKHILDAPIPIIATMRSKMAYEAVQGTEGGKGKVQKVGMQAEVRGGTEYEFGLVFTLNMAHKAEATKDRTHIEMIAGGNLVDLTDRNLHAALREWMRTETPASAEEIDDLVKLLDNALVPDVTRRAVQKYLAEGTPGAGKVRRYADKIITYLESEVAKKSAAPATAASA